MKTSLDIREYSSLEEIVNFKQLCVSNLFDGVIPAKVLAKLNRLFSYTKPRHKYSLTDYVVGSKSYLDKLNSNRIEEATDNRAKAMYWKKEELGNIFTSQYNYITLYKATFVAEYEVESKYWDGDDYSGYWQQYAKTRIDHFTILFYERGHKEYIIISDEKELNKFLNFTNRLERASISAIRHIHDLSQQIFKYELQEQWKITSKDFRLMFQYNAKIAKYSYTTYSYYKVIVDGKEYEERDYITLKKEYDLFDSERLVVGDRYVTYYKGDGGFIRDNHKSSVAYLEFLQLKNKTV